jgi:hypothetical protein
MWNMQHCSMHNWYHSALLAPCLSSLIILLLIELLYILSDWENSFFLSFPPAMSLLFVNSLSSHCLLCFL